LLVEQVIDPFDPEQQQNVIADPTKNEWDAIEVRQYDTPPQTPSLPDGNCYLNVVDIRNSELTPQYPYDWDKFGHLVGSQGNAVKAEDPDFLRANVEGLSLYGVDLWRETHPAERFRLASNYHGFSDKWLMGKQPMMADGSVNMQVPCDQPFQMSAYDELGTVIAHDPITHSLRPGETRTCYGCHDGHSTERRAELGTSALVQFADTVAAETDPALMDWKQKVPFSDVTEVLVTTCANCHDGFEDDGFLWSRVAADKNQFDWDWIERKQVPNGNYRLHRPYFSFLVARHPRWSPLYWYCMNERLDGYSNGDFPNDIDFRGPHDSGATQEQCDTIANWINLGAARNDSM
jgi:hypothetical protein